MKKQVIETKNAPQAIGVYSQAVRAGNAVYLSGQIARDPETMQLAEGIDAQIHRFFENLRAVAVAAGGNLDDMVKLTVYLTDLVHFAKVNDIMTGYFSPPYPAHAAIGVAALPRNALVKIDAVMLVP